jgi:hypothetical protein
MIAALWVEFCLLYLLYEFIKHRANSILDKLYVCGCVIWGVQAMITIAYLTWKYLP